MDVKEWSNLKAWYFRTKNTVVLNLNDVFIPEYYIDYSKDPADWSLTKFCDFTINELFFRYKPFASHLTDAICMKNVNKLHIYINPTLDTFPSEYTLDTAINIMKTHHICKAFSPIDVDDIGPKYHQDYQDCLATLCNMRSNRKYIMREYDKVIRARITHAHKQRIKVIYHFSNTGRETKRPKSFKYSVISHYVRSYDKDHETT